MISYVPSTIFNILICVASVGHVIDNELHINVCRDQKEWTQENIPVYMRKAYGKLYEENCQCNVSVFTSHNKMPKECNDTDLSHQSKPTILYEQDKQVSSKKNSIPRLCLAVINYSRSKTERVFRDFGL